jgi:uncharacterized surface protein with fasciclin (FAS1) repeats
MTSPRSMLKAAVLAAPLSALALNLHAGSAQAADIIDTIKDQQQFSILAKAIDSAGIAQSLKGEGPYTVFAPTDRAFDQLPPGAVDALMKQENQAQLKSLLQYHVVEGEEITADALGKQTDVDTASGERLAVDETGGMVMLLPASQAETETQVSQQGDMPATEHQQEVMATQPGTEQQQTMPQDTAMPASPHQKQVLEGEQGEQQAATGQESGEQAATETQVTEGSDMPASEHQQQVMATQPDTEQQETMPQDTAVPSSPHQEQVLKGQQPGEGGQQGVLREATVVEPDIQADNGVIHVIDAVLVPPSALSMLEKMGSQGQNEQSMQQTGDKQG